MAIGRTLSDANILIGGLLTFWGGLAELYMFILHEAPAGCTATSIEFGGTCYALWPYLLAPIGLGVLLLLLGATNRPAAANTEDLLRTDPYTRMVLTCFLSLALAAGIWALVAYLQWYLNDVDIGDFVIRGISYGRLPILNTIAAIGAIVFGVGFGINAGHVLRRRRFVAGFNRARKRKAQL